MIECIVKVAVGIAISLLCVVASCIINIAKDREDEFISMYGQAWLFLTIAYIVTILAL